MDQFHRLVGNDLVDGNLPDKRRERRDRRAPQRLSAQAATAAAVGRFNHFSGRRTHGNSIPLRTQPSHTNIGCDAGKS